MSSRLTNLISSWLCDTLFAVFNSEAETYIFFNYVNNKQNNIKFTMEKEIDNKL